MKILILILSLSNLFFCSFSAFAETASSPSSPSAREDLSSLANFLGQPLELVLETLGMPEDMFSVRGPSEGQDSVVFLYKNRLSFYWADRHVWQVRADREFLSERRALFFGMTREDSVRLLGDPDLTKEDLSIYTLPQRGYPVACALYFEDGLSDLYVYRSDF
ncbi:hypothetical protein [Oceanispirochaeta sp.]|jgi:hypothetical protein|uniref:hypothetical protein n=1 Tax=Oceanispirochaeta sp. TaxID=2035350 RepID=UPI00261B86B4|nr:hypothetical protein [Oceanispirochaeta sp.]MDA3958911.1 hypothetical protein [Oceanispirochaeta sp.]